MLTHSDSIAKIGAALAKFAASIENPHKNATNPHFRNKYADLAEIINTSRGELAKVGVTVIQCPGMEDGDVTVASMLLHESGEWIQGIARSPIPKADPQGVGSATTYLRRYSLAALLGLAQEDDDGEGAGQGQHGTMQRLTGEAPAGTRAVPPSTNDHRAPAPSSNGAFSLNDLVPVGKHKGRRWADLVELQPDYVEWAIKNLSRLGNDGRRVLQEALDAGYAGSEVSGGMPPLDRPGTPLSEPGDGLPF